MALRDLGRARAEVWPGSTVGLRRVPTVPVTPPAVHPGPRGSNFEVSPNRTTGTWNTATRLQDQQYRLQTRRPR